MKKFLCRSLSVVLASLMIFSAGCNKGDNDTTADSGTPTTSPSGVTNDPNLGELKLTQTQYAETSETVSESYTLNLDSVAAGVFSQPMNVKMGRGNSSSAQFLTECVSQLRIIKSFGETSTSTYEGQIQCQMPGTGWDALYFGLRNTGYDPTVNEGVWFVITQNHIGLRVGTWPNAPGNQYVSSPVDFGELRRFRVVDDPVKNEICFYVFDDSNKEILAARVVIKGDESNATVEFYEGNSTTPKFTNTCEVPKSGQASFWCHYPDEKPKQQKVYVKNFTITGSSVVTKGTAAPDYLFTKDVFADTWVATDDEGRIISTSDKAVNGNDVGIFYFLWHQGSNRTLYDHSKAYYEGGVAQLEAVMKQGSLGFGHFWAEPYFGYYNSYDEWVMRKHIYMLNDAGVDFLFFDFTNGIVYEDSLLLLLNTMVKMREEGYNTPQIVFHCGDDFVGAANASLTVPQLWTLLYSVDRYKDLWYLHDGKPLILAQERIIQSQEMSKFFTFRRSWADSKQSWYADTHGKGCWPWGDVFQKPGLSPEGELEQMIVMSGFWANGTCGATAGRSFSNGKQPDSTDYSFSLVNDGTSGKGLAYQEHFNNAIEQNPGLVMIVGWNEWWAGRWESNSLTNHDGMTVANTYQVDSTDPLKRNYYVDAFNPEFSRDIEPVNGIYKDNYYYQTALNVRNYKGTRGIPAAFGQKTIDMAGDASQWYAVGPEFRDYQGDITHRNGEAYVSNAKYVNTTGRNDFVVAKVSADADNVYFFAECASDITAAEGTNWMNLFIDVDCDAKTGWYGYDYIINRSQNGDKASVEKFATTEKNAEWSLSSAGEAEFKVVGNTIVIKVAKSVVALGDTFDFKWADNSVSDGKEILQFLDLGDAAPNGRFNYRYTTNGTVKAAPACLESGMTVLKAGSYNAYVGGKEVMLCSDSTKAVALGEKGTVYLPRVFAESSLGLSADSLTDAGKVCGVTYVAVNDALAAQGKVITITVDGLIVIADKEITDAKTLSTLYRSLM